MTFWQENYAFIKDVYDMRHHKMAEWIENVEKVTPDPNTCWQYPQCDLRTVSGHLSDHGWQGVHLGRVQERKGQFPRKHTTLSLQKQSSKNDSVWTIGSGLEIGMINVFIFATMCKYACIAHLTLFSDVKRQTRWGQVTLLSHLIIKSWPLQHISLHSGTRGKYLTSCNDCI